MVNLSRLTKRISYITAATVMSLSTLLALLPQNAFAAQTQATARQIKMSSSAAANSGTTYEIKFNVAQGYAAAGLKGIVVEFCSDTPIVDSTTCTNTNSFSTASVTLTSTAGTMDASGWAAAAIDTNKGIAFSKAAGNTGTITSNDTQTITVGGILNPNAIGTFYARIYTYASTAAATGFLAASGPGAYLDYGGVALAVANQVTVTAKVQETLLFCVYTTGANCAGASGTAMTLGDSQGVLSSTTTNYLTSTNASPTTAKLGLASNATTGVDVRAKASGTLTSGANTIASSGNTCTNDSAVATTEQFGMTITAGASQTDVTYGTVGTCSTTKHAFNTTNLTATFGDLVLTTAGPTTEAAAAIDFMGKASTTTKPGVYTMTMGFIATGKY